MLTEVTPLEKENELVPQGSYGQGNILINAAYAMPLAAKRLILLGLARISYAGDTDFSAEAFTFKITAKEWQNVYGNTGGPHAYHQMARAADKLMETKAGVLVYRTDNRERKRHWFSKCDYHHGDGYVVLTFDESIRPNLKDLVSGGDYTPVDLMAVCALGSTNSIRLFELCRQYRKTGVLLRTIEDFRTTFGVENKYQAFGDLRKRVIEPAVEDICNKTPLTSLGWEPVKKGPKIVSLRFTFNKNVE